MRNSNAIYQRLVHQFIERAGGVFDSVYIGLQLLLGKFSNVVARTMGIPKPLRSPSKFCSLRSCGHMNLEIWRLGSYAKNRKLQSLNP